MQVDPFEERFGGPIPSAGDAVRVFRIEDERGLGPVPGEKEEGAIHTDAIRDLLRDLRLPAWIRGIIGRRSAASASTRHRDWVFGTVMFRDILDYSDVWVGHGCAMSIYDVPRLLLVEGDTEVMFWRGDFRDLGSSSRVRRHPSGLVPTLRRRVSEADVLAFRESEDPA